MHGASRIICIARRPQGQAHFVQGEATARTHAGVREGSQRDRAMVHRNQVPAHRREGQVGAILPRPLRAAYGEGVSGPVSSARGGLNCGLHAGYEVLALLCDAQPWARPHPDGVALVPLVALSAGQKHTPTRTHTRTHIIIGAQMMTV